MMNSMIMSKQNNKSQVYSWNALSFTCLNSETLDSARYDFTGRLGHIEPKFGRFRCRDVKQF